jgi:hypothetical protein
MKILIFLVNPELCYRKYRRNLYKKNIILIVVFFENYIQIFDVSNSISEFARLSSNYPRLQICWTWNFRIFSWFLGILFRARKVLIWPTWKPIHKITFVFLAPDRWQVFIWTLVYPVLQNLPWDFRLCGNGGHLKITLPSNGMPSSFITHISAFPASNGIISSLLSSYQTELGSFEQIFIENLNLYAFLNTELYWYLILSQKTCN